MRFLPTFALCVLASAHAADFPAPYNSGNDKDARPPMTGEEAVKAIKLPPGFKATLFAAEPDVQNPIACAWDSRGRLWVAENYTYAEAAKGFDLSLRDRILIFEDTDNDGRHDKRTVFADNLTNLTSIELGYGGVYATAAPHLLFIPDKDRDDKPDGAPEVLLDGFDDKSSRHNFVNGLKWGPDGWLYGRHGILATSNVGRPGAPNSERVKINCGIWRFHPARKSFEVVTWGGTNPWGHDWNAEGEGFFTNTVTGHLYHIIPGAHYERMYGEDLNPHIYQLLPQTADHYHYDTSKHWTDSRDGKANDRGGGHAHTGCMIYLGENWPEQYRGKLFTINLHGRRLNVERLERKGSSYTAKHEPDFASFDDPWFRGVDLTYGPDGGVYVLDWSDQGECHENDGVHRQSGRIYKITHKAGPTPQAMAGIDLTSAKLGALAHFAINGPEWHARMARRLLAEHAAVAFKGDAVPQLLPGDFGDPERVLAGVPDAFAPLVHKLVELFENPHTAVRGRLRAIQCLHLIGAPLGRELVHAFRDADPSVKAAIIHAFADNLEQLDVLVSDEESVFSHFTKILRTTPPDPKVSLGIAQLAHRLRTSSKGVHLLDTAVKSNHLLDGEVLQLTLWALIAERPDGISRDLVATAWESSSAPVLLSNAARYLAIAHLKGGKDAEWVNLVLEGVNQEEHVRQIVVGFAVATKGIRRAEKPKHWDKIASHANRIRGLENELLNLNVIFGDGRALDEIRNLVLDAKVDPPSRRQALETLITSKDPYLRGICEKAIADPNLAHIAMRGFATFDDPKAAKLAIANWNTVRQDARSAVVSDFATRPVFARALLEAIASGQVAREEITPYHARQIAALNDASLSAQLAKVWGEVRVTPEAKRQRIAELKGALAPAVLAKADIDKGRAVFTQACAACHRLFDLGQAGTQLGPNLTGSGRENIDYLLENIVDPNALVPQDYKLSVITTKDGRTLSGFISAQTEQTLTLRTMTDTQNVAKSDVAKTETSPNSLMPEGLLDALSAHQVRDLFGLLIKK